MPRTISYIAVCSFLVHAEVPSAHYTGAYVNSDYGFSVTVPSGHVGLGAAENAPNHGFSIKIAENAIVSVAASYDTDTGPAGEEWTEQMIHLHGKPTQTLGGLRAWRVVTRRGSSRTESITACRVQGTDVPIIYSISVETSAAEVSRAAEVFEGVVKTFRLRRIGN